MGSKAAKRYAKALFALCRETQCLDAVNEDLTALRRLKAASDDFAHFMEDPMISPEQRARVLDELLVGKAHPTTIQFLHFLENKRRLAIFFQILPLFEALVHEDHGILKIGVRTASPLTDEQVEQIKQRMHERFDREILASVKLDPSLIGGFKVRVRDTIYDYSIATQLETLKRKLITT